MSDGKPSQPTGAEPDRRTLLANTTAVAMTGALVASYGTLGAMMGRFLYPAHPAERSWLFVIDIDSIPPDGSFPYRSPAGLTITITRKGNGESVDDFLALSSICPHLGCRVHWEAHNERFFCPCHNGVFSPDGHPVSGPPADADQSLPRFPLKLEGKLLFIQVVTEGLTER